MASLDTCSLSLPGSGAVLPEDATHLTPPRVCVVLLARHLRLAESGAIHKGCMLALERRCMAN